MPQTMKLTAAAVWKAEKEHWGPDTPNKPTSQHRARITSGMGLSIENGQWLRSDVLHGVSRKER